MWGQFSVRRCGMALFVCMLQLKCCTSIIYTASPGKGSLQACIDKLSQPGDECHLQAGRYYAPADGSSITISNLHGAATNPIVIGAAPGVDAQDVILDGTAPVNTPWKPAPTLPQGIFETKPGFPVWQLFVDGDMMVNARWPNAYWHDKSMFLGPERWAHAGPKGAGSHNTTTGNGTLHDAGACSEQSPPSMCCSYCNNNSLAKSGVNATGMIAILNMWADGTGVQKIKYHVPGTSVLHYNATWCKSEIEKRGKCGDGYRDGLGKYYIEGGVALLDTPTEWAYSTTNGLLYLMPMDGRDPSTHSIRSKVQNYAFDIKASSYITFANMTFFATSMQAFDDDNVTKRSLVTDLKFEDLDFNYPSASRRMLGDLSPIPCMNVWTDQSNPGMATSVHDEERMSTSVTTEGCRKELSMLCGDNAQTMNETLCLACVQKVNSKFKSCSVKRATSICTKPRPACMAACAKACPTDRGQGPLCTVCLHQHASTLGSANCSARDEFAYCGAGPSPPGKGPQFTRHAFEGVRWRFADGMALQAQGSGWTFRDCTWEWNSWTALGSTVPNDWQNGGVLVLAGLPPADNKTAIFSRLSFSNNGASKCLRPPGGSTVIELVHFQTQLELAGDGCMVETGGSTAAHMLYNWAHSSGKSALRFDGTYASGTANGVMAYNVAWNISALMVKGDNHTIAHNTGFDASDIGASWSQHSFPRAQSALSNLTNTSAASVKVGSAPGQKPDHHTRFTGNLFDGAGIKTGGGASSPRNQVHGIWDESNIVGNWEAIPSSYDIKQQLRDPWNRDFRPCPVSLAAMRGAGAYPTYSATDTSHWIPGARASTQATQPSPQHGAVGVAVDVDLIFLGARRAVAHVVLLGTSSSNLKPVATLQGSSQNVAHIPADMDLDVAHASRLAAGRVYVWRVDAVLPDGTNGTGDLWTFSTDSNGRVSCSTLS